MHFSHLNERISFSFSFAGKGHLGTLNQNPVIVTIFERVWEATVRSAKVGTDSGRSRNSWCCGV